MIKIIIGFLAGAFYGAMYVVEVPNGVISKAMEILKMFFFS